MSTENNQAVNEAPAENQEHPEVPLENIQAMQERVASTILKSDQAWDVINELGLQCVQQVITTKDLIGLIVKHQKDLKDHHSDYTQFENRFYIFRMKTIEVSDKLKTLVAKHKGKKGKPLEKDWPVVTELSLEYSTILEYFEQEIQPLVTMLTDDLKSVIKEEESDNE